MDTNANNAPQPVDDSNLDVQMNDGMTIILKAVAAISLVLMLLGFLNLLGQNSFSLLPGPGTVSLSQILDIQSSSRGIWAVSVGLILFALIPSLRILLSFQEFIRLRDYSDALISVIVFAELLLAMFL